MMLLTAAVFLNSENVFIHDGDNIIVAETSEKDYINILAEAQINLGEDDAVLSDTDEYGALHIYIERAFDVKIFADGIHEKVRMTNGTVADALDLAGISIAEPDLINVSTLQEVSPEIEIIINRVTLRDVIETEVIGFDTVYTENDRVYMGETSVINEGQEGIKTYKYTETLIDGDVSNRELMSEEITVAPVNKVIEKGTKVYELKTGVSKIEIPSGIEADENGLPLNCNKIITGKAAAYSARAGAKTASGLDAIPGHVAVDPNIIPYGTKLYIASTDGSYVYGYAIAADTGTALMEGLIVVDLFFSTNSECRQFGIKEVNIFVLD